MIKYPLRISYQWTSCLPLWLIFCSGHQLFSLDCSIFKTAAILKTWLAHVWAQLDWSVYKNTCLLNPFQWTEKPQWLWKAAVRLKPAWCHLYAVEFACLDLLWSPLLGARPLTSKQFRFHKLMGFQFYSLRTPLKRAESSGLRVIK